MESLSANWIWMAGAEPVNSYVDFQSHFDMGSDSGGILLAVSVDGDYIAYINGMRVAFGQFADQPAHKVYQSHDISKYCQRGDNTLSITAWHQGIDCMTCIAAPAGIMFAVTQGEKLLCASDTHTLCAPTPGYRCGDIERITPQLGLSFDYTAGCPREPLRPAVLSPIDTELSPRETLPLQLLPARNVEVCIQGTYSETDSGVPAVRIARASLDVANAPAATLAPDLSSPILMESSEDDGIFAIIDLGRETSGMFTFDAEFEAPAEVLVGFGEHIAGGRVRTEISVRNFGFRYMAQAGRNQFLHLLRTIGARYLELHMRTRHVKLNYAGLMPLQYPVDQLPKFECESALHQRIYDVCRATLLNCMHSHYEDCPWREQALYACDSRNQMLAGYYVFGETTFARASLRLLAQSQRGDGLLEICSPAKAPITIPSFSLSFIIALEEYLRYSGDAAFVREMLPVAEGILDAMSAHRDASGLITNFAEPCYWNFYEWREQLDGGVIHRTDSVATSLDAPLNALCALACERLARMYGWLEMPEAAQRVSEMRAELNSAAELFWDNSQNAYADYIIDGEQHGASELTQTLMLLSGAVDIVPDAARRNSVLYALTSGTLTPVTLCYTMLKYDALFTQAGARDYSDWVWRDIERIWGDMLNAGATTFWETELGQADFDNAGSLCHGWSAAPAYIYFAYGLGLKPTAPGYRTFEIKPVHMDLGHVGALIHSPNGYISLERNGAGTVAVNHISRPTNT